MEKGKNREGKKWGEGENTKKRVKTHNYCQASIRMAATITDGSGSSF